MSSLILMSGSCENGAVAYGYFMYDVTKYPVGNGYCEEGGSVNGSYYFQLLAVTAGWDPDGDKGTGDAVAIELFSQTDTVAVGIYTYAGDTNPNWKDPYTFMDLRIVISYNPETDMYDKYLESRMSNFGE
jgi:hypothetical protein